MSFYWLVRFTMLPNYWIRRREWPVSYWRVYSAQCKEYFIDGYAMTPLIICWMLLRFTPQYWRRRKILEWVYTRPPEEGALPLMKLRAAGHRTASMRVVWIDAESLWGDWPHGEMHTLIDILMLPIIHIELEMRRRACRATRHLSSIISLSLKCTIKSIMQWSTRRRKHANACKRPLDVISHNKLAKEVFFDRELRSMIPRRFSRSEYGTTCHRTAHAI